MPDKTLELIERMLAHCEHLTEAHVRLKARVAVLERQARGAAAMVPVTLAEGARSIPDDDGVAIVQGWQREAERRRAENERLDRDFEEHGAEAKAIRHAEHRRLYAERPALVAEALAQLARLSREDVRQRLIKCRGRVKEWAWDEPWLALPSLQIPTGRAFVRKTGDRWEVDIEAMRTPVRTDHDAGVRLLKDWLREHHPALYEHFVTNRMGLPRMSHKSYLSDLRITLSRREDRR